MWKAEDYRQQYDLYQLVITRLTNYIVNEWIAILKRYNWEKVEYAKRVNFRNYNTLGRDCILNRKILGTDRLIKEGEINAVGKLRKYIKDILDNKGLRMKVIEQEPLGNEIW